MRHHLDVQAFEFRGSGLALRRHVARVVRGTRRRLYQALESRPQSQSTAGALAAASWLRLRGVNAPAATRWHVQIALDVGAGPPPSDFDELTSSRFHLDLYSEEWGVFFCHGGQASWVRVIELPLVHGRDDFSLLGIMPALKNIGVLLRSIERHHVVRFQRRHASVRTNLPGAEPAIRRWLESL